MHPGATIPPPATEVPPPPPPPNGYADPLARGVNAVRAAAGMPSADPMTLAGISALYAVPLPLLLRAAAHDVGPSATTELIAEPDQLHGDVIAKVNAGARLVFALYHSGKDVVLGLPDPALRAYRSACEAFEVRPALPGGE
jgi:hypothetical protein